MIESALVFDDQGRVIRFHLPHGRTQGSIPDTRDLWEVMWKWRAQLGGVAHTHPWNGRAAPSQGCGRRSCDCPQCFRADVPTFRGCEQALGSLLLWPVVTFDDIGYYGWNSVTEQYVRCRVPTFEDTLMPAIERLRELSQ